VGERDPCIAAFDAETLASRWRFAWVGQYRREGEAAAPNECGESSWSRRTTILGGTMGSLIPVFAPLGRLYDPLLQLAERVHRALAARRRMVWTDERGSVFVHDLHRIQSMSPRSIVGMYDIRTPVVTIEADLRLALRARARSWIIDWNASLPDAARAEQRRKLAKPRGRPRRGAMASRGMQSHPLMIQEHDRSSA
jgi:hypothetical protein